MAGYDRPGWPGWPGLGDAEEQREPGPARGRRPDPYDQLPPPPPDPVDPVDPVDPPGFGAGRGGGYPGQEPGGPFDDLWEPQPQPQPEPEPEPEIWEPDDWESEPERVPRPRRADRSRKSVHRRANILWRWRRPLFIAALLVMAVIAAGVSAVAQVELPDAAQLYLSSYVCTAEVTAGDCSSSTAAARLSGDENREYVRLDQIPEVVRQAVIATEDRDFYEHDGIDPLGIARALYQDLRGGGLSQGGSTITQQFVKNTYLGGGTSERTITRKIREAILAIKAEQEMSKDEILEGYLNTIYFGRRAYGIQAAARVYFGLNVGELHVEQASYLASLIRAPGRADAHDPEHPEQLEEATRRRTTVLTAMVEEGYISQADQDRVETIPLNAYVLERSTAQTTTALWGGAETGGFGMEYVNEYVRSVARRTLVNQVGFSEANADRALANGGLRIYTTINRTMQQQAYGAVWSVLDDPVNDPGSGLVAIDDQGQIRAMVGGRDYWADNNYAQINFATDIQRQVGSTFKPIVLATAAANNVSFSQTELTAPAEKEIPAITSTECDTGTYHNYSAEEGETGTLDLYQATAASSNTAFAELMYELGNEFGADAVPQMAERLGWNDAGQASEDDGGLSRCIPTVLGSEESNPLEMAEVYSTFANRGVHREPTIITRIDQVSTDGEATNLWSWQPETENALTNNAADLVTSALEGVIDHGTGTGANIGRPSAGKTGTTSNSVDSWFVGYTPHLTAAVWMGYAEADWVDPEATDCNHDQPDPEAPDACLRQIPPMSSDGRPVHGIRSMTGGQLPAQIWATFMTAATTNIPPDGFNEPTEELRQQGRPFGDGGPTEPPPPTDTTLPPDTTPTTNVPTTPPITIEPPTSSTTDTTLFPFPTSTTLPDGGGGGRGP